MEIFVNPGKYRVERFCTERCPCGSCSRYILTLFEPKGKVNKQKELVICARCKTLKER